MSINGDAIGAKRKNRKKNFADWKWKFNIREMKADRRGISIEISRGIILNKTFSIRLQNERCCFSFPSLSVNRFNTLTHQIFPVIPLPLRPNKMMEMRLLSWSAERVEAPRVLELTDKLDRNIHAREIRCTDAVAQRAQAIQSHD